MSSIAEHFHQIQLQTYNNQLKTVKIFLLQYKIVDRLRILPVHSSQSWIYQTRHQSKIPTITRHPFTLAEITVYPYGRPPLKRIIKF